MKIRTAVWTKGEQVSTYRIGINEACNWTINGELWKTMQEKALAAANISPTNTFYKTEGYIHGGPDWDFEVKIFKYSWKELK